MSTSTLFLLNPTRMDDDDDVEDELVVAIQANMARSNSTDAIAIFLLLASWSCLGLGLDLVILMTCIYNKELNVWKTFWTVYLLAS